MERSLRLQQLCDFEHRNLLPQTGINMQGASELNAETACKASHVQNGYAFV